MSVDTFDDLVPESTPDAGPSPSVAPDGEAPLALQVRTGARKGSLLEFAGPETVLGRNQTCHVQFDEAVDRRVSGRHAILRRGPRGWTIEDLGSTNGTHVNGEKIESATPIEEADRICLGREGDTGSVLLVVGTACEEALTVGENEEHLVHYACASCGAMLETTIDRIGETEPCRECAHVQPVPTPGVRLFGGSARHASSESVAESGSRSPWDLIGLVRSRLKAHEERRELKRRIEELERELPGAESSFRAACGRLGAEAWGTALTLCRSRPGARELDELEARVHDMQAREREIDEMLVETESEGSRWVESWKVRREPVVAERDEARTRRDGCVQATEKAEGALTAHLTEAASALEAQAAACTELAGSLRGEPNDELEAELRRHAAGLGDLAATLEEPLPGLPPLVEARRIARSELSDAESALEESEAGYEQLDREKARHDLMRADLLRESNEAKAEIRGHLEELDQRRKPLLEQLGEGLLLVGAREVMALEAFPAAQVAQERCSGMKGELESARARIVEG